MEKRTREGRLPSGEPGVRQWNIADGPCPQKVLSQQKLTPSGVTPHHRHPTFPLLPLIALNLGGGGEVGGVRDSPYPPHFKYTSGFYIIYLCYQAL